MKILVADGNETRRESIVLLLLGMDHTVSKAGNVPDATDMLRDQGPFDSVITDIDLNETCGIELLQYIHLNNNKLPTYVHCDEPTFFFDDEWWRLAEDIPKYFGHFASFRQKGNQMMQDITDYVNSIQSATS